jgi:ATP-dependent RNA helicase DeaD
MSTSLLVLKKERRMETVLFNSLNLSPEVLKAIENLNYTEMTAIQGAAIPLILSGHDVIGRSQTGTGKTAAFGIPAVESIKGDIAKPQVLILCPTRELAMQISGEMQKYSVYKKNVSLATVYGGQSMDLQIRQLRKANIVIGTPGRIMDHMRRRTLKIDELKIVILDEADEMLDMGFFEDIQTILAEAPEERQTLLFSATMPPAIMKLTKEFQNNPEIVEVAKGQKTLDLIAQYYYYVPESRKIDALNLIIQMKSLKSALIFCNTKKMVDELVVNLNHFGYKSIGLHGDMKQSVRTQVMQDFKSGKINILIATDVAARGIDAPDIEAVINYDIPQEYEYYIHRIGRTGRAGKTGASYTLVTNRTQLRKVFDIQRYTEAQIIEEKIPTVESIKNKNIDNFFEKIKGSLQNDSVNEWQDFTKNLIALGYDAERIACTLIGMLAEDELNLVPNIDDIIVEKPKERVTASIGVGPKVLLNLNVGSNQNIAPNYIVAAVVEGTGLSKSVIGKINIFKDHTEIEMKKDDADLVMDVMQDTRIRNMKVTFTQTAYKQPAYKSQGDSRSRPHLGYGDKTTHSRGKREGFRKSY